MRWVDRFFQAVGVALMIIVASGWSGPSRDATVFVLFGAATACMFRYGKDVAVGANRRMRRIFGRTDMASYVPDERTSIWGASIAAWAGAVGLVVWALYRMAYYCGWLQ